MKDENLFSSEMGYVLSFFEKTQLKSHIYYPIRVFGDRYTAEEWWENLTRYCLDRWESGCAAVLRAISSLA